MNKKNYIIIGGIIVVIAIAVLFLLNNNKANWMKEITEANNYEITMKDCNNRETAFPKEEVSKIFDKWNSLSDNGPWTGEEDKCYSTVTITYEKNNVIQKREIKIIDDNSIVLVLNDGNRYYTNAKNVVDYLNELFNKY